MKRRLVIAAGAAALLGACGGGGGGGGTTPPPSPPMVGRIETFTITSQAVGVTYNIEVYLPPQYDTTPNARFPTIYAVDGDARFGYPNNGTRTDAFREVLQRRTTPAILVGIGGTARRVTDFLPGGATPYHQFVSQELVARVEGNYRADPAKRILSGLSYGGSFVFLAFTMEAAGPVRFQQFWSIETAAPLGSMLPMHDAEAAAAAAVQGRAVPVTLFMVGATGANAPLVNDLHARVAARAYPQLVLDKQILATTHVGADLPSFEDALTRLLP